ncbi:2-keto-4-pentenoate hydratase [Rhizobium sp. PP-F2F-G20b]|nr:2-keto-4-pentenoate hydratase [Rhizobium sp. PP-F2F-G20b]
MSMDLADILAEAIRNSGSVDIDAVPQPDLAEAYAIQSAILSRLSIDPKGHKLSLRSDGVLRAPLLSVTEAASFPYQPGLKLEVEIALVLRRDLPVRAEPYSRQEIRDAIGAVHIGIELVRSRYAGGPQGRTALLVADLMSNAGYRLGPSLDADVLDEGRADNLRVTAGDQPLFDAPGAHPDKDPLAALVAYANEAGRAAGTLLQGMVVTTGSLCGGLTLPFPAIVSISLGQTTWSMDIGE